MTPDFVKARNFVATFAESMGITLSGQANNRKVGDMSRGCSSNRKAGHGHGRGHGGQGGYNNHRNNHSGNTVKTWTSPEIWAKLPDSAQSIIYMSK